MEDFKLALAWLGVIATIFLDHEDNFFRLTNDKKFNKYAISKYIVAGATLIYSILGFLGKI